MSTEQRRGFLRVADHQAQELERWAYPDYSDEVPLSSENALNYVPSWHDEAVEELEEPEPPPLTAADLDEIRQSAFEEGIAEGREAGYSQGHEQGIADGFEQGHAQGLEQGLAQGLEQGQEQINQQAAVLVQLADQLATPLAKIDGEVERQLIRLVTTMARELVQVELQINPQVILQTIREGIAALPVAGQKVIIQLHPEDLALVREAYGDDNLAERQWSLQGEPAMNRGDLHLASGTSTVDFPMEQRIRQVLTQFIGRNSQQLAATEHQPESVSEQAADAESAHQQDDALSETASAAEPA